MQSTPRPLIAMRCSPSPRNVRLVPTLTVADTSSPSHTVGWTVLPIIQAESTRNRQQYIFEDDMAKPFLALFLFVFRPHCITVNISSKQPCSIRNLRSIIVLVLVCFQAALQAVCEALLHGGHRNASLLSLPSVWLDQLLHQLAGETQEVRGCDPPTRTVSGTRVKDLD